MPAPQSVLALIGNTPMVEVTHLDTGPCRLFLKLESQNPGGSIKDRIGLSMIEAAEREGKIAPGKTTLIEATAGNTGLGLALVAAQKGYRLLLIIPDKMSQEKINHLRALGAEIVMTRSDVGRGHPAYYQDMAERLEKEIPGGFWVNQFANPANPLAHETGTGPEIWAQMDGDMDAMVCGVGSGGTLSGLGRYFKKTAPNVEMVLADPKGSILAEASRSGHIGEAGSWLVEGIGEDFIPPNCDLDLVGTAITVDDREAFATVRELLMKEGILAGTSSGTLIAAALRYCRAQTKPKRVVTFVCDSGNKYLSKAYNDFWLQDQGLTAREKTGDLRDLIARQAVRGEVVSVEPGDTLLTAYGRMRLYDISQRPVLADGRLAGILDESDLLLATHDNPDGFRRPVSEAMTSRLETVAPTAKIADLMPIFRKDHVAIVVEGEKFLGLITKVDLINHLRQSVA